ncbi:MAG TPA: hypothetical protein VFC44_22700 [Candidatus Saccharimonadales bacterium]|nr:hypothetical protein [Candidatus Saccharimonadales bacterium]
MTTADLNGDGLLDLIVANYGAGTLTVLTQTLLPPTLAVTLTASNTLAISWTALASGYTLQTNANLTSAN